MIERRRLNQPKSVRPFRYSNTGPHRQPGRRALLRALAAEYEFGNSLSKLYVSLLARAVVAQDPRLLRKPTHPNLIKTNALADLERCGVRVMDAAKT